jgi:hypothetical protein
MVKANAVDDGGNGNLLDGIGGDEIKSIQQSQALGAFHQCQCSTGAGT